MVVSRSYGSEECVVIPANNPEYIYSLIDSSYDAIVIDEAQFFYTQEIPVYLSELGFSGNIKKLSIVDVVQDLADKGYYVIISGLDMTSDRKPFNHMPELLAIANEVVKLRAVCECCKNEWAQYSYTKIDKDEDILVGATEYIVVCRECYKKLVNKRR